MVGYSCGRGARAADLGDCDARQPDGRLRQASSNDRLHVRPLELAAGSAKLKIPPEGGSKFAERSEANFGEPRIAGG